MILIAEDNDTSAKLLELILRKQGHETIRATTGREALELLEQNPDIRLVISDVMMPELDGIGLLKELRESSAYSDLPVIMCTSLAEATQVKEAARLGCTSYLIKPVRANDLAGRIRRVLHDDHASVKSSAEMMRELGVDNETIDEIAATFRSLLETEMVVLESGINDEDSEGAPPDWDGLIESARIFGAERLVGMLTEAKAKGADKRLSGLRNEMLLIRDALPQPKSSDDPEEDAPTSSDDPKEEAA